MNEIERRVMFAEMTRGAVIYARRRVPFPHRYTLERGDERWALDVPTAEKLVEQRFIAGRPIDALWDNIEFKPDTERVRREALTWWPNGFGWCATCRAWMAVDAKGSAPRHGHVKLSTGKFSEPCGGTGTPMTDVVRPAVEAADAA